VVKVEIGTFWVVILTPTAGDGLRQARPNFQIPVINQQIES
jgi:hypothetical protein